MKRILLVFLAGLAVTLHAEVKFLHGTLAEAVKKAEAEKKPVMIDFLTDWCRWCDTLDRNTYSDARVAGFINARLVPIKIDAEKGEGIAIAKKYGVAGYPTVLVIRAEGTEIDRLVGYMPPGPFLESLAGYLEGVNTVAALKEAAEKNPDALPAQYNMARKYGERNDLAAAAPYYQKVLALDPADTAGHGQEARATLMSHFIRQKDGGEAKRYFEQYLAAAPDNAAMMNEYAWGCSKQKINLDHAAEVAARAVSLTSVDAEKAAYLDTEAAVEFARGGRQRAIALEDQALSLLKDASAKKRKPYEEALAKYKAAPAGLPR